jgi:Serine/threonine protein phosphatase
MIEHGHATHRGLQREHNEDNYWADARHGLWLVADGMGGPGHGEVASAIAVEAAVNAIRAGIGITDAFRRAGAAMLGHPARQGAASPMGSTLAAIRLHGRERFEAAWIGDSRIYAWRDGKLARLPTRLRHERRQQKRTQPRPKSRSRHHAGAARRHWVSRPRSSWPPKP